MKEIAELFERLFAEQLSLRDSLHRSASNQDFDSATRLRILDAGWNAVTLPEESGGSELCARDAASLAVIAGKHLLPMSLLDEAFAVVPALHALANPELADLLGGAKAGGAGFVALTSPEMDSMTAPQVKTLVRLSHGASFACLVSREWVAMLPLDDAGTQLGTCDPLARGESLRFLQWGANHARTLLPGWGSGQGPGCLWLLCVLADLTGCAQWSQEKALHHAKERKQFGQPIGSFQVIGHALAEMRAQVELMRSGISYAAGLLDHGYLEPHVLAGLMYVIPAFARAVCESAIQIHGGAGFTWEYGLHLPYRRVLQTQAMFGGSSAAAIRSGEEYLRSVAV